MTDLNLVYGYPEQEQSKQMMSLPSEQRKEPIQSHAQPPEVNYRPPDNMYVQQDSPQLQSPYSQSKGKQQPSYSFWDRLVIKRPEVMKLAMFALVILLAIALDRIGTHYLTKYLSNNIFTEFQEFIIRLSYPILIFILLPILKSFFTSVPPGYEPIQIK